MAKSIDRPGFIEQAFKNIRGRQHGRNPRNKQQRQTKVLEREVCLEKQSQQKADRELEEDAEESEKDGVDQRPPENRVRECGLILGEAIERHVSADKGVDRGFSKTQRQTVQHRVKQQYQAENDEGQDEHIRRSIKTGFPDNQARCIRSVGSHHLIAPRVTPATIKRLAKMTKSTAGMAVRTLPGNRNAQSMPY